MSNNPIAIQSEYTPSQSYLANIAGSCLVFLFLYLLVFLIIAFTFRYNIFTHGWANFFVMLIVGIITILWAKGGYNYEKTGGALGPQDVALIKTFGTLPDIPIRLTNGKFATIPKIILWDVVEFVTFYIGPEIREVIVTALTLDKIEVELKVRIVYHRLWNQLVKWAGFKPNYVDENIADFVAQQSAPLLQGQTFDQTQSPDAIKNIKDALLLAIQNEPGEIDESDKWAIGFDDVLVLPIKTLNTDLVTQLSRKRKEQADKEAETLESAHVDKMKELNYNNALALAKKVPGWQKNWDHQVQLQKAEDKYYIQVNKMKRIVVDGTADRYVQGQSAQASIK